MKNQIEIRDAVIGDAISIAGIFNYYVRESTVIFSNDCVSADEIARIIADGDDKMPFLVAECDGKVIGYSYAHRMHADAVYGGTREITIYLDHDVVERGIGGRLLDNLISRCREAGLHTLISIITEGNVACESMHASRGFRRVARLEEVGYKFGQYLNDVYYQLLL